MALYPDRVLRAQTWRSGMEKQDIANPGAYGHVAVVWRSLGDLGERTRPMRKGGLPALVSLDTGLEIKVGARGPGCGGPAATIRQTHRRSWHRDPAGRSRASSPGTTCERAVSGLENGASSPTILPA